MYIYKVGWSAIFGLNFLLIVVNLLYIGFAVVDKKKSVEDGTTGDFLSYHILLLKLQT